MHKQEGKPTAWAPCVDCRSEWYLYQDFSVFTEANSLVEGGTGVGVGGARQGGADLQETQVKASLGSKREKSPCRLFLRISFWGERQIWR